MDMFFNSEEIRDTLKNFEKDLVKNKKREIEEEVHTFLKEKDEELVNFCLANGGHFFKDSICSACGFWRIAEKDSIKIQSQWHLSGKGSPETTLTTTQDIDEDYVILSEEDL